MDIGIVGLGLIGGSLAKSIKNRTLHTVWGIDQNPETMSLARLYGAIDGPLDEASLAKCDLVLLAIRPAAAIDWVRAHEHLIDPSAILVDLCGVKRNVVRELAPIARRRGFSYIGGHPMAGRERGGFTASSEDLFVGASMILTPDERTDMALLEALKDFFTDVGFAGLTFSTPEEHDQVIAYTSQLAHVASSAFIKSPASRMRRGFSAGSYRDLTRVARLDEDMWTELFLNDADNLQAELEIYIEHLNEYLQAIRDRDETTLRSLLREGREMKAAAGGN